MASSRLYLQLHSLRHEAAVDAEGVVRLAAAMGFDGVELVRDYGWPVEHWQRLLEETGLTVIAAHSDLESLENDYAAKATFHRMLGNRRLVATALSRAPQSPERYHDGARRLNAVGRRLREEGFTFIYHHHSYEFEALSLDEASCGMDILLAETDPTLVRFEFDSFWLEFSGQDAVKYISEHADRAELLHAKDLRKRDRKDVPAGQGDVDFSTLIPLCAANGWPVVLEFEGADALASVRQGGEFLRRLLP